MSPEMRPDEDIQRALDSAQQLQADGLNPELPGSMGENGGARAVQAASVPFNPRFALMKFGLMAERYPWQTTAALLMTTGCGYLCPYFGWTALLALAAYAVTVDD